MEYTNLIESLQIKDNNHSKIQVMSWFHQFCSRHTTNNSHIKPILQLHWLCWADPSCGASLFKWMGNPGYETFTKNHASKIFQGSRTAASPQRLFGHVSIFRQIEKSEQNTTSYGGEQSSSTSTYLIYARNAPKYCHVMSIVQSAQAVDAP